MFFRLFTNSLPAAERNCAYLVKDSWDDWFKYQTTFTLHVYDEDGVRHHVGSIKIAHRNLRPSGERAPGQRSPELPTEFEFLDESYFSLGMGEDYYATLNTLSAELRQKVLIGLRDCAYNLSIFEEFKNEDAMDTSLLRSISVDSVRGRLHRLAKGDARLTEFHFTYTLPNQPNTPSPIELTFDVTPESLPPTNVHVLIGRNGVGKTRCIGNLIHNLINGSNQTDSPTGSVTFRGTAIEDSNFSSLVHISFSAFDSFEIRQQSSDKIVAEQVGLKRDDGGIKSSTDLSNDFLLSLKKCRSDLRSQRWKQAINSLEVDDLFAEANVTSLLDQNEFEFDDVAKRLFTRLSSGHAIILLTITRLVELVEERTLVLLDEPEGHLHPPLLSAFIRALSDLLIKRNGVAIVATHSPVVLQEVPRCCAWKIRRSGAISVAERPTIETFGENIGILTREVFGLEVTKSGFHQLIEEAVSEQNTNYQDIVTRFDGQLGAEAKAIIQALLAERNRRAE